MADQIDWVVAAKYLAGEASALERAEFEAWLSERPDRAELLAQLSAAFTSAPLPEVDVDAAWSRLRADMEKAPVIAGPSQRTLSLPSRLRSNARHKVRTAYWAVPALAAAGVAAILVPRAWQAAFPTSTRAAVFQTVATASGERRSLSIGDGISVIIGPSTTLDVERPAAGSRTVRLNGEAYFTVRHDPHRRFYVRTASAVVEDIGTGFNVRSVAGLARTEVSVVEGVVALRGVSATTASPPLEIRAGGSGIVEAGTAPRVLPGAGSERDVLAWTRGELVFRDTRMSEVALELRRWYGLDVAFSEAALQARTLSARFSGEPRETVVRVIARTMGLSYQLEDNGVTFSPRTR